MNNKNINKKQNKLAAVALLLTAAVIIGTVWAADSIYENQNNAKHNINEVTEGGGLDLNSLIPQDTTESLTQTQEQALTDTNDSTEQETISQTPEENYETAPAAKPSVDSLINPVSSSTITMAYSYGTDPVFSKTFNEYRSDHTGVDIAASVGEEVKCALAGKVVEIRTDPKLGKTIKIEHEGGIYTEYSNLSDDIKVIVNDNVEQGQVIGTVGTSALYESADDPHVHFALIIDGAYVDPAQYLSFN